MKSEERNPGKELYNRLRRFSCRQLWENEVPQFNSASPEDRFRNVAVVRAVGVVFSESGTVEEKAEARLWLNGLLNDPDEKVRRYAMKAMPKIGAGLDEEKALLSVLRKTESEREKKFLGQALDKIGGAETLKVIVQNNPGLSAQTELKVRASVARNEKPSRILMDRQLSGFGTLRVHLRGRTGLEQFVADELQASVLLCRKFKLGEIRPGLVVLTPVAPFSLADLYSLRCFGTAGLVTGGVAGENGKKLIEALAAVIASPLSRRVLGTFTGGAIRYRLDFTAKGHQRGAVREIAARAYVVCPEMLNDARNAPWAIDIHPAAKGRLVVELRPRFNPDPRFDYRRDDVPAASHPPLAACLARLAGFTENEIVWDPFCGSGLELIERTLLGGVQTVHGTDLSAEAIGISRDNFAAAKTGSVMPCFTCCDFRDYPRLSGLGTGAFSLIISNPPMGRRVPIPNLRGLIQDFMSVSSRMLKPGGRLVFANPLDFDCRIPGLILQSSRKVDFGGFHCRIEKYLKRS